MFTLLFTIVSSAPTRVTGIYLALNTYLWKEWMNPDMSHGMADTELEDLQSFHIPAIWSSTIFTSLCYTFFICKRKRSNFIYKKIYISFSSCITLHSCLTRLDIFPGPYPSYLHISAQFPSIGFPILNPHLSEFCLSLKVHFKCHFLPAP